MRMYSNMVLLTLEQVAKIYGFTDKNKAKPHNRRTESVRRASRDVLSWRRCNRHRQAAYWHCTIKCTRKKKIQCKTTTSQPIWLQSRSQLRHQAEQASLLLLDGGAARTADCSVGYDVKNL